MQFERNITLKTFLLRFVNSYAALYYVAFAKPAAADTEYERYVGKCACVELHEDGSCVDGVRSCMNEVGVSLGSIFLTQVLNP